MQVLRRIFGFLRKIPTYIFRASLIKIVGAVVVSIILLLALWKVPQWQADRSGLSTTEQWDRENEARKTLAQIIGGFGLLIGLYLTHRRVTAAEETVKISQEGQVTERFTRAIEQLGSNKLEVRLGGIYALERIAKDSPKDHWTIMEVLTAYVRENAKWEEPEGKEVEEAKEILPPPTDIQAVLDVLSRRVRKWDKGRKLDLREIDLCRTYLAGIHLENALLWNVHLEHADLSQAHLEGADLRGAHLEKALFTEAHLKGADLTNAHLENSKLLKVDFIGARLVWANLERAYLGEAHLENASFEYANMKGVTLGYANLNGANLKKADLEGVMEWRYITNMNFANIWGVKHPPLEKDIDFEDWAIHTMGAVSIESNEEWERLKESLIKEIKG